MLLDVLGSFMRGYTDGLRENRKMKLIKDLTRCQGKRIDTTRRRIKRLDQKKLKHNLEMIRSNHEDGLRRIHIDMMRTESLDCAKAHRSVIDEVEQKISKLNRMLRRYQHV